MSEEVCFDESADVARQIARHQKENWANLSPEKRSFGACFVTNPTIGEAAVMSGLTRTTGKKYYNDPVVRAYINYLYEVYEETYSISAAQITAELEALKPKLLGEEPISTYLPGIGMAEVKKFQPEQYLKVLQLQGQHIGYQKDELSQAVREGLSSFFADVAARGRERNVIEAEVIDET